MSKGIFATAINCMDGRTQLPVHEWMKKEYGVDYVDTITEPGPNGILAKNGDMTSIESIKKRVLISVEKHHSKHLAIVGHYDCAGNPGEKEIQVEHILMSVNTIKKWNLDVEVVGLWVGETFAVEKIV